MKAILLATISALFVFIFAPTAVLACSCGDRPTQEKQIDTSENVFVGRIVDVIAPTPPKEGDPVGDSGFSIVLIEKVYKGELKVGGRFPISNGDGVNCAYMLGERTIGETWLFYVGKAYPRSVFDPAAGKWKETGELTNHVSFCGRSGKVDDSSHDLAYLDNIGKHKGKNRLSGKLIPTGPPAPDVAGMRVNIIGKQKRFTTRVTASGYFEMYDIPHGEYVVEFETPPGLKLGDTYYSEFTTYPDRFDDEGLSKNQRRVSMGRGHYGLDFSLAFDTRATGRIFSAQQTPLPNVCVAAMPADGTNDRYPPSACTDKSGTFSFNAIKPGAYHLVVNIDGKINKREPFGRIFYPGVIERSDAGVIVIEPGRELTNLDIQIVEMTRLIDLTGKVLFADGQPVDYASVRFVPANGEIFGDFDARPESDGSFVLKIPFETAGEITAERYFGPGNSSCPQIDAAREAAKSNTLKTNSVSISADNALTTVILRFPFEHCEKQEP